VVLEIFLALNSAIVLTQVDEYLDLLASMYSLVAKKVPVILSPANYSSTATSSGHLTFQKSAESAG